MRNSENSLTQDLMDWCLRKLCAPVKQAHLEVLVLRTFEVESMRKKHVLKAGSTNWMAVTLRFSSQNPEKKWPEVEMGVDSEVEDEAMATTVEEDMDGVEVTDADLPQVTITIMDLRSIAKMLHLLGPRKFLWGGFHMM
mmetsp:Transcript_34666/g.48282  ORF Transcript_34666/g.48282 Transcript_34666/m.48282 type:complete len:139 (-) Transcript_34666:296-712(-)